MATGSGANNSSRTGLGNLAGSTGKLPGGGGTSCGEPGPILDGAGFDDGMSAFDMVAARCAAYKPKALVLTAS